jgi:hypothetical protein
LPLMQPESLGTLRFSIHYRGHHLHLRSAAEGRRSALIHETFRRSMSNALDGGTPHARKHHPVSLTGRRRLSPTSSDKAWNLWRCARLLAHHDRGRGPPAR